MYQMFQSRIINNTIITPAIIAPIAVRKSDIYSFLSGIVELITQPTNTVVKIEHLRNVRNLFIFLIQFVTMEC